MSNNAHELSNRLLNALDSNYNVVDMQTVNEIISILEKFNITKELLETTRLGKHVNELRRKTSEPTLARRAKVLVKRWRDLVIPTTHSPAHTGSNRSSAERQVRRLGGTPLTSPALSRNLVSPAVPSPRPPSRPAWGGYESDSQDVILVDDDPPPPATPATAPAAAPHPAHKPATPPVKRALSPEPVYDEKKAKRDKKPKKRRGHGRAGSGTETTAEPQVQHNWVSRNGTGPERRRNGWRREPPDPYTALVNRLPPAGAKKVKTTKELLEQIQSRGNSRPSRPASPRSPASPSSPASPDVMLIEPDVCPIKIDSPLRNGGGDSTKAKMEPKPEEEREEPLPLEEPRTWEECTCGEEEAAADCPAAGRPALRPLHVRALHNALLPGLNGTRAPLFPHRFAVRPPSRPDDPTLFSSVVPLYNYSDYADDHCVKNMSRVPLCESLPWTDFAPSPPAISPPPSPPPLRPYPSPLRDDVFADQPEPDDDSAESSTVDITEPTPKDEPREKPKIEPAMVGVAYMEPGERLKAPLLDDDDEIQLGQPRAAVEVEKSFVSEQQEHRTVERTKAELDGRGLYSLCEAALASVPYRYSQAAAAPVLTLPQLTERDNEPPDEEAQAEAAALLEGALETAASDTPLDALGRPQRPALFAEWHECAKLGDLVALPYVVID